METETLFWISSTSIRGLVKTETYLAPTKVHWCRTYTFVAILHLMEYNSEPNTGETNFGITRANGWGGFAVTNHSHVSKRHESVHHHVQLGTDKQSTSEGPRHN